MDSNLVRKHFVEFFKTKSHQINISASLVVKNDPTLMFVNSGMVPFKEFFLENSIPKYKRITNSQKCLLHSGTTSARHHASTRKVIFLTALS